MQSGSSGARGSRDPAPDVALTEHERAQEKLYRIWRAGRLTTALHVEMWAESLKRLELEGGCRYFAWIMQRNPELCNGSRISSNS